MALAECENCGEERWVTPTLHGNICHPCEELLEESGEGEQYVHTHHEQ